MRLKILSSFVNVTSYSKAAKAVAGWACNSESRYVCIANVHVVMEAWDSPAFREVVNTADLVTPDGMPLVWLMSLKGQRDQQRVYGPTLMLHVLEIAAQEKIPVGFYGSTPDVLHSLVERMQVRYEDLEIALSVSPPFRVATPEEDARIIDEINRSGAKILFVGLGCPKQEIWMKEHRGRVNAAMLGVGAAFDFHSGFKPQAPAWMQKLGLEWLFRLLSEPGRLWKRYLYNNPRFLVLAAADLLGFLKKRS